MGQRLDDVATNCRQISSILVPHTVVEEEGLFPEMAEELPDHIEVLRGEHREIESVVDEAARGFPGDPTCPDRLVGGLWAAVMATLSMRNTTLSNWTVTQGLRAEPLRHLVDAAMLVCLPWNQAMMACAPAHAVASATVAGTDGAVFEGAALVLGQAPPHAGVVPKFQGETQAGTDDRAAVAHRLGLLDLHQGWAGVADRKEQFGLFAQASTAVRPVHGTCLWGHLGPQVIRQERGRSCGYANRPCASASLGGAVRVFLIHACIYVHSCENYKG